MKTYIETIEFLNEIEKDYQIDLRDSLSNYISEQDFEDFNQDDAFNSLYNLIQDQGGFDQEVIYYSYAIEYLSKNDPSLQDSIKLASDLGYETSDINSELLASLLKSENERENFCLANKDIENFFK